MAKEWFYTRDGRDQTGPVAGSELKQLAAGGEIRPSDLIWKEGMPKPVAARQVKGLFNLSKTPSAARRDETNQSPATANPGTPIRDCGVDLKALDPSNGVGDTPQGHCDFPPYRPTSATGYKSSSTEIGVASAAPNSVGAPAEGAIPPLARETCLSH
jgi:hypothetical protein